MPSPWSGDGGTIVSAEVLEMTNQDLNSFSSAIGRAEMHVCFKVKYCHEIFFFGGSGRAGALRGDFSRG